ncbi:hypothetical protein BofuT4_P116070.1 [Botrytis cinerea T4]|uniref:Uncharacterized protein n=1 Tax=Botryotinia fuckeliana (strain T4) TaxID=999810 RepID=G2Y092_BOTF4|nr:hypothetical protein BofuT4_P116070.1 [Botrytis cinerea T4]
MENLGMKGMDGAWQWRVDGTPWNILSPKFLISDENNPPSCRFPGAKAQVVQICDVIKIVVISLLKCGLGNDACQIDVGDASLRSGDGKMADGKTGQDGCEAKV